MPDEYLAAVEPAYLDHLRKWVEAGNRVVIAPASANDWNKALRSRAARFEDILRALGVEGVSVVRAPSPDDRGQAPPPGRAPIGQELRKAWEATLGQRGFAAGDVPARAVGKAFSPDRIEILHVPSEGMRRLELDAGAKAAATGLIELDLPDKPIVAAVMPVGTGDVVVLPEPYVMANAAIRHADNAVLAYDIAATPADRTVTFDEFYHGLSVRGNPLWLLTRPVYASMIASCSVIAGLVLWRRATAFGPPLDPALRSRRTVIEYVEATAKFLGRGRGAPVFVLEAIRSGVLHELARSRHGEAVNAAPDAVLATVRRRSPEAAERLEKAIHDVDAAVALGDRCSRDQAVQSIQGILQCLSRSSTT
jgi:hypothetical protein